MNTRNICQLQPSKKLSDKYLEPFEVLQAVENHGQAYKLNLPSSYHIYNIFHISLLELWHSRGGDDDKLAPIKIKSQLKYEVESIKAHKDTKKKDQVFSQVERLRTIRRYLGD